MAEGGVAAALGHVADEDTWQVHFRDTMVGGKLLNHPRMAELHAQEAPDRVRELERWGAVFDRTRDGRILQRPFGGHSHPRLAHVGDRTGLEMIRTLQDQAVAAGIDVYMECTITHLTTGARPDRPGRSATGATTGRQLVFPAKADRACHRRHREGVRGHLELVGVQRRRPGAGLPGRCRADRHGVRPVPPDRHGLAARRPRPARDRGRARRGRHPAQQTASGSCGSTCPRIAAPSTPRPTRRPPAGSRRCRRDATTDARRPPELSTRDNVARAIYTEVKEGRGSPHGGVFLDISYLPADHVRRKLPSMYEQFKELADVDITTGPMEVGPTTHYVMGGIRVDPETGATTVPGLFAAGEVAGGMHGANRLGGNSLSDLLVFGARTGAGAAALAASQDGMPHVDPVQVEDARRELTAPSSGPRGRTRTRIQRDLQSTMQRLVGIFRIEGDLGDALAELAVLRCALGDDPRVAAARPSTRAGTSSTSCATC